MIIAGAKSEMIQAGVTKIGVLLLSPQFFDMADTPTLSVTMLGAGREVGRSCCVLQYQGRTIVCDAGIYSGMASLHQRIGLEYNTPNQKRARTATVIVDGDSNKENI